VYELDGRAPLIFVMDPPLSHEWARSRVFRSGGGLLRPAADGDGRSHDAAQTAPTAPKEANPTGRARCRIGVEGMVTAGPHPTACQGKPRSRGAFFFEQATESKDPTAQVQQLFANDGTPGRQPLRMH
jgi:hypothetical protein